MPTDDPKRDKPFSLLSTFDPPPLSGTDDPEWWHLEGVEPDSPRDGWTKGQDHDGLLAGRGPRLVPDDVTFTEADVEALRTLLDYAYDAFGGNLRDTEADPAWQRGRDLASRLSRLLSEG